MFAPIRPKLVWRLASFAICLSVAPLLNCSKAHAQDPQCAFTMSNISFGTVDLKKGNPYDAAGTFTYACTGDRREILRICPSWGIGNEGARWMTDSAGDKLMYNLYTDPDRNTIWGTWYSKDVKGPSIDVPLGRSEKTTGSVSAYGRITANQQSVPPGAYKATINGGNVAISYGYASKGSCESFKHGDRVSLGFTVTANVSGGQGGPGAITAPDATKPSATNTPQVTPGQPDERKSVFQKLTENAQYQQQQRQKSAVASSDSDNQSSPSKQEDRAKYLETHACMTTDGADKANELADDCNKVTSSPHKGCNIQQNTCEEIRKNTQKGCWGLGASAPDFCLTKYR